MGAILRTRSRATVLTVALALILSLSFLVSAAPTAEATTFTGKTMVATQKMSGPTLSSTQLGTVAKGTTLTLSCYTAGQAVKGYYSGYFTSGYDTIWYRTSGGYYVADVDLYTGGNNPKVGRCDTPSFNTWKWLQMTAKVSGKRVDVRGASTADGAAIQQYTANTTNAQMFNFIKVDWNGTYRIVSRLNTSKVIEVKDGSTANGAKVQLGTWSSAAKQKWVVKSTSTPGYYTIRPSNNTGKCLDVPGGSTANSKQLQIYTCNGTASQLFKFTHGGDVTTSASKVDKLVWATKGTRWANVVDSYAGECVSLVSIYLNRVYGLNNNGWGNASAYKGGTTTGNKLAAAGFKWHASTTSGIRNGDILVWTGGTGGYGHIGLWYDGQIFDQNDGRHSPKDTANFSGSSTTFSGLTYAGYWSRP